MNMDDVTHCPPNWPIQVLQITIIIIYLCFILTTAKFIWHENILSLKMHKNEKKVCKFIFNFAIQFAKFTQHENAFSLKHTISTHAHKWTFTINKKYNKIKNLISPSKVANYLWCLHQLRSYLTKRYFFTPSKTNLNFIIIILPHLKFNCKCKETLCSLFFAHSQQNPNPSLPLPADWFRTEETQQVQSGVYILLTNAHTHRQK